MKGFKNYQGFCREYFKLMWSSDTPYFNHNFNDFFIFLSPKEIKGFRDEQYHKEQRHEYPLWFIADTIQGWQVDYMDDRYENYNDEQSRREIIFRKKMAKLFKKYSIAPDGWIHWYKSL